MYRGRMPHGGFPESSPRIVRMGSWRALCAVVAVVAGLCLSPSPAPGEGVPASEPGGAPGRQAGISLTEAEREYLARKKQLTYCVDPDWDPIERIDDDGRHVGISSDFLDIVSERLGIPLMLVPTASWNQTLAAARARRCDMLPAAHGTPDRREYLNFTTPYLRFPMVVATLASHDFVEDPARLEGESLGVVNGYASLGILRARYPGLRFLEVPSAADGLRLVAEGKLHGYIDIAPSIKRSLARGRYGDVAVSGRVDAQLELAVACRNDEPELVSVLQKVVDSLSREESDAMVRKWLVVSSGPGRDPVLVWGALAGAAVLGLAIWRPRAVARLRRAVRKSRDAFSRAQRRLAALLDCAGQGFLCVGATGLVEDWYSRECRNIFGGDIAGRDLPGLLFPGDEAARASMAAHIRRITGECDACRRELYVSLLPATLVRGESTLRLAYHPLADGRLLLVVTDITETRRLGEAVNRERGRLACVAAVAREQRDFFDALDAFAAFRRQCLEVVAAAPDAATGLEEASLRVSALKGLFLQLECAQVSGALEALEGRLAALSGGEPLRREAFADVLAGTDVDAALERDLDMVREALGWEFFERRGEVCLSGGMAVSLAAFASRLLGRADAVRLGDADVSLLRFLETLAFVDMRKLLSAYPRITLRLASDRGKVVAPFSIEGDTIPVDQGRFGSLAKTLAHAFRNAVDHGLESPEERAAAGKDTCGRISCRVSREEDAARIVIADDGRGVDVGAVRSRAFELGLAGAEELAAMDEAGILELLFREGFSSPREHGERSGPGTGLAAIWNEARRLGGSVAVENAQGRGMRLVVTVPLGRLRASIHGEEAGSGN